MIERTEQDSNRELPGEPPVPALGSDHSRSTVLSWIRTILRLPGLVAILLIRFYQILISPLLGKTCRFHPSCSQYFILAVKKYGLIRGSWKGTLRICRCHPWNPGGYDPP